MDINNIQSLVDNLVRLGFSPAVEYQLLYHVCLRQREFTIRERKAYGPDIVSYSINCKVKESVNRWFCSHYDAILRKTITLEPVLLNGVELDKTEERMRTIDWRELAQTGSDPVVGIEDRKAWEAPVLADEVMGELEILSQTAEGKETADTLRFKYWADSPLERLIPNLSLLKSRFELSQRFYILGKDSITADEAFRFLNNRWIQRQMQNDKKIRADDSGSVKQLKKAQTGSGKGKVAGRKTNDEKR